MGKKKSKSLLDQILFLVNSLAATLLLLAYLLPYISPIKAPTLAVLSLIVPVLIFINVIFGVFWLAQFKRKFFLSTFVIILGFGHLSSLFQFSSKEIIQADDFSIMSYNVKMFNHYGWNPDESTADKTYDFINQNHPDILVLQEFYDDPEISFEYSYRYVKTRSKKNKFGLAIFSNFPIISSGSLDLKNSANNIIYADLKMGQDTVRVYNIHLESFGLKTDQENFGESDSDKLLNRMKEAFRKQGYQAEQFLEHSSQWNGRSIVCGDFNNTAFSWVYKKISEGRQDAFKIAGSGTGKSFNYNIPLRIDFILPDDNFDVNLYETFDVEYSDHFPILARLQK